MWSVSTAALKLRRNYTHRHTGTPAYASSPLWAQQPSNKTGYSSSVPTAPWDKWCCFVGRRLYEWLSLSHQFCLQCTYSAWSQKPVWAVTEWKVIRRASLLLYGHLAWDESQKECDICRCVSVNARLKCLCNDVWIYAHHHLSFLRYLLCPLSLSRFYTAHIFHIFLLSVSVLSLYFVCFASSIHHLCLTTTIWSSAKTNSPYLLMLSLLLLVFVSQAPGNIFPHRRS